VYLVSPAVAAASAITGKLTDVVCLQEPRSWWDYQKRGFMLNHGLRIDHTFVSESLLARVRKVTIHRDVRGWENPSDHAPVSVDLALSPAAG
jgi:exodeoxyribonuclease-3